MKRFVGEALVMRELGQPGPHGDRYEVFEERYIGADPKKPKLPGRYIEVKVVRNFRVDQVVDYKIEELD